MHWESLLSRMFCLSQIDPADCVSYLPAIGRFLIVVTFIEDALRIITQWSDQLVYLKDFRHSMSVSC